jgi:hypothetical protein
MTADLRWRRSRGWPGAGSNRDQGITSEPFASIHWSLTMAVVARSARGLRLESVEATAISTRSVFRG